MNKKVTTTELVTFKERKGRLAKLTLVEGKSQSPLIRMFSVQFNIKELDTTFNI